MERKLGLYVTLGNDGSLKRTSVSISGETELEATTLNDEVILFSELIFDFYAFIVDRIRLSAAYLVTQDGDGKDTVDMRVFEFIQDTVQDLIEEFEEDDPLYGTLTRTIMEDRIPAADGSGTYPVTAVEKIISELSAVMLTQFSVNNILRDMRFHVPIDLDKKYRSLQEVEFTQISSFSNLHTPEYLFRSAADYYTFLVLHFIAAEPRVQETAANTAPLLKRAFIFLEDGDWSSADEYCEKVLDLDPECAQAYLGKLMAELRVRKVDELANCEQSFDDKDNYRKVMRFGGETLRDTLEGYITKINDRNENARLAGIYNDAANAMSRADSEDAYRSAADRFKSIPGFKDANALAESCLDKAEICRKDGIYSSAKSKITEDSTASCEEAIQMFQSISGWKDADEQICACQKRIEEIKAKEKAERLEAERKAEERRIAANKARRKRKKAFVIGAPIVCACIAFVIVLTTVIIPKQKYNKAIHLLDSGDYAEAAITFGSLGNYKDARDRCIPLFQLFSDSLSAKNHTVALKADGTVMATGYNAYGECDVSDWKDVVDVSAGYNYTISLKANGTVVATGYNEYGQCDVLDWVDIVSVSAGHNHTIGLKADGTVVATGNNASRQCNVSNWKDIVAVSAGHNHTIGLKADGTVVATGYNEYGQCDVLGWTDIVSVSAGNDCTIGLKTDGTVVAVGYNEYGQCDVLDWVDIVAVSAGHNHTIGLKADGTVVAAGRNHFGQCNVSDWVDIVAVSAGHNHTIGLKADGTLVATGSDRNRQCDVSDWTNITTKQPMA